MNKPDNKKNQYSSLEPKQYSGEVSPGSNLQGLFGFSVVQQQQYLSEAFRGFLLRMCSQFLSISLIPSSLLSLTEIRKQDCYAATYGLFAYRTGTKVQGIFRRATV